MGFRLTSFLGGASEQFVKTVEAREKEARDTGLLAGKSLYDVHPLVLVCHPEKTLYTGRALSNLFISTSLKFL